MMLTPTEFEQLYPILEQIRSDLIGYPSPDILVLRSAAGNMVFWLAERMEDVTITGLELDEALLDASRKLANRKSHAKTIDYIQAGQFVIPYPDDSFDALISEFILFPTSLITMIGQPEMERVLKPGGSIMITDMITTRPLPHRVRIELQKLGLDYLCAGSLEDFRNWMHEAGFVDVEVMDLTSPVRKIWENRRRLDPNPDHAKGYAYLLDDPVYRLGETIFPVYIHGKKPESSEHPLDLATETAGILTPGP